MTRDDLRQIADAVLEGRANFSDSLGNHTTCLIVIERLVERYQSLHRAYLSHIDPIHE